MRSMAAAFGVRHRKACFGEPLRSPTAAFLFALGLSDLRLALALGSRIAARLLASRSSPPPGARARRA